MNAKTAQYLQARETLAFAAEQMREVLAFKGDIKLSPGEKRALGNSYEIKKILHAVFTMAGNTGLKITINKKPVPYDGELDVFIENSLNYADLSGLCREKKASGKYPILKREGGKEVFIAEKLEFDPCDLHNLIKTISIIGIYTPKEWRKGKEKRRPGAFVYSGNVVGCGDPDFHVCKPDSHDDAMFRSGLEIVSPMEFVYTGKDAREYKRKRGLKA